MTEPIKKDLITMTEAAKMLGCHAVTVNRYCKRGLLPYFQFGNRKRFLKDDVQTFLEGARHEGHAETTKGEPVCDNPFNTKSNNCS